MKFPVAVLLFALLAFSLARAADPAVSLEGPENDPYLAYETMDDPGVLEWIRAENEKTQRQLQGDPRYGERFEFILGELDSLDRLVVPSIYRDTDTVLNFWRDADHPQGIVRESTLEKFFDGRADWQTILDFDELSREEGKTWVYSGVQRVWGVFRHGMIALSDGGKDAVEYREYDYVLKRFIPDGFSLPESKSSVRWLDADTLLVASAVDPDDRTESGYPGVVKIWKRGAPFSDAETLFTSEPGDMAVSTRLYSRGDGKRPVHVVTRQIDFYNDQSFLYADGNLTEIRIPSDASLLGFHKGHAFVWLKSDWEQDGRVYVRDSLIHFPAKQMTADAKDIRVLYEPAPRRAFQDFDLTDGYVYLSYLEDVQPRVVQYEMNPDGGWTSRPLPLDPNETARVVAAPRDRGFLLFVQAGFLKPATLYRLDEKTFEKTSVQALPARFDAERYAVSQEFAVSADGTRVPYFVVRGKDTPLDGDNPVLQYGYGGFMSSLLPVYSPIQERCWLRDGGVFVMANIRGGSEYGPDWHEQALKENRPRAFEDFIAVSEDLIRKKYTSPARLGIEGGSNGGLLVAAVMVMRPDLYNAVVCEVPLLDMLRFHKLPPGASWIGEYGNPDVPKDRQALLSWSPYQNLRPPLEKGAPYPVPFIATSTKDDRVHPGHARKFAKRLEEFGCDFLYYEELEGGHSGNANSRLAAKMEAMKWVYLYQRLAAGKSASGEPEAGD